MVAWQVAGDFDHRISGGHKKTALESQKGRNGAHPPVPLDSGTLDKHHEPNTLRYHDLRRSHPVSKPWTPVDSGYVMHEIGMVKNC
jgi:hypothetical protein